jgi:hypothetical protein
MDSDYYNKLAVFPLRAQERKPSDCMSGETLHQKAASESAGRLLNILLS